MLKFACISCMQFWWWSAKTRFVPLLLPFLCLLLSALDREFQKTRTSRIDKRKISVGIGLHSYGGQDVPWSALCKLKNQESCGVSPTWVKTFWKLGVLMSEGRRIWMSLLQQRENSPFLSLFVLFRSWTDWMMPALIGECDCFYSVCWFKC